jgi:hypothetical protein
MRRTQPWMQIYHELSLTILDVWLSLIVGWYLTCRRKIFCWGLY